MGGAGPSASETTPSLVAATASPQAARHLRGMRRRPLLASSRVSEQVPGKRGPAVGRRRFVFGRCTP